MTPCGGVLQISRADAGEDNKPTAAVAMNIAQVSHSQMPIRCLQIPAGGEAECEEEAGGGRGQCWGRARLRSSPSRTVRVGMVKRFKI